jgi:hypothetical protein
MHAPDPIPSASAGHSNGERHDDEHGADIEAIVQRGPGGAFAVAGLASAIVIALFFLFYFSSICREASSNESTQSSTGKAPAFSVQRWWPAWPSGAG